MSLLREIQDAAIDPRIDILVLLRKCRVLASRLKHEQLKQWVDGELNGYSDVNALPSYRVLNTISFGHFAGPFGSGLRNASIPTTCVPENCRDLVEQARLPQSISEIADLASRNEDHLRLSWPPELCALVGQGVYQHMNMLQAWQVVPRSALVGIVETVRNKVLNFALEIEATAPVTADQTVATDKVSQERVSQVFQTVIMGNVGNLASGSRGFAQVAGDVVDGDFGSLRAALSKIGVDEPDIGELKAALEQDSPPASSKRLGSRVSSWIGKMVSKSAQGLWDISTSVASDTLSKLVANYYGLAS